MPGIDLKSTPEWDEVELGAVCEFRGGSAFKPPYQGMPSGDHPFIKVSDMNLPTNSVSILDANNWVSGQDIKELRARLLPEGTVVFAKIGEALRQNRLRRLTRETAIDNNMVGAVSRLDIADPLFLYYALSSFDFSDIAQGTALPYLTISTLSQLRLPLPPLEEQRAIARVLGALDDRIELNRRMSETLEEMARALFRSWFVDFDPVRAKAAGRPSGLPPDLDALFPASLEASELGEIPAGWEVRTLGEVAQTVRGRSYRSAELAESNTALVTLKSFARGGGYRPDGLKAYTGRYKPEQIVRPGELVIACTDVTQAAEVVGRPAIVQPNDQFETLVASLDTLIVRPRDSSAATVPFLYCLGRTPSFTHHTYSRVSGTTVLHLAKDAVPSYQFAAAPRGVLDAFNSLVEPIFSRLTDFSPSSDTIRNLRDRLLPRLVSGELRVRGV